MGVSTDSVLVEVGVGLGKSIEGADLAGPGGVFRGLASAASMAASAEMAPTTIDNCEEFQLVMLNFKGLLKRSDLVSI